MITLRTAGTADARAVLIFWSGAATDEHRPPDTTAAIERLIRCDPDALVVATNDDGEIVGSVIAGWDGWRCHLYRLAVRPDHRRRGLGRRLVAAAEARFVEVGATRVDAIVLDANVTGHLLWADAGYARQDGWSRWVKPL